MERLKVSVEEPYKRLIHRFLEKVFNFPKKRPTHLIVPKYFMEYSCFTKISFTDSAIVDLAEEVEIPRQEKKQEEIESQAQSYTAERKIEYLTADQQAVEVTYYLLRTNSSRMNSRSRSI